MSASSYGVPSSMQNLNRDTAHKLDVGPTPKGPTVNQSLLYLQSECKVIMQICDNRG